MKFIMYLITMLTALGSYALLQGDCSDGLAQCNDLTMVSWPCVYKFPGCVARDYPSSNAAAEALCKDHKGVGYMNKPCLA